MHRNKLFQADKSFHNEIASLLEHPNSKIEEFDIGVTITSSDRIVIITINYKYKTRECKSEMTYSFDI